MAVNKAKVAAVFTVAGFLTVVFGTVLTFVGPLIIDDQIVKNTVIDPKNDVSYTMWRDIPVPFYMSVYFFNVLNPKEILKGEKPMVEQRGPYVYRKRCQKDNITFHPNNTVSYKEYRRYYFEPSMSVGNESDIVTIPNMLVLGASVMLESLPIFVRLMISATFKTFKEEPFLTKTVEELMWGYDSKLVEFLNKYLPGMLPSTGKFGLFAEDDIRKVHKVDSSMELEYQRPGEFKGIPLYRYVAPKTLFANGTDYSPNEGFCPCRQSGLLNVSSCRQSVPLNVSIRLQLNLYLKQVGGITETGKISEVVMPMLWFEEVSLHTAAAAAAAGITKWFLCFRPRCHQNVSIIFPVLCVVAQIFSSSLSKCSGKAGANIWMQLSRRSSYSTAHNSQCQMMLLKQAQGHSSYCSEELQSGYIDGPILNTFHTNLVVLPAVMEYMQYGFIALGLVTITIAVFVYHRVKRSKSGGGSSSDETTSTSTEEKDPLLQEDTD
ncbi:hypothetical protein INR49_019717 [Caranx melampygus]|nr:hypothetical protein INR49_019717 [Caranx melampygus]